MGEKGEEALIILSPFLYIIWEYVVLRVCFLAYIVSRISCFEHVVVLSIYIALIKSCLMQILFGANVVWSKYCFEKMLF